VAERYHTTSNLLRASGSFHYEDERLPLEALGLLRAIERRCRDVFSTTKCQAKDCDGDHLMFVQLDISYPESRPTIILNWAHSAFSENRELNADLVYAVSMMLPLWAKDFQISIT
jgi:hypothetical protein